MRLGNLQLLDSSFSRFSHKTALNLDFSFWPKIRMTTQVESKLIFYEKINKFDRTNSSLACSYLFHESGYYFFGRRCRIAIFH